VITTIFSLGPSDHGYFFSTKLSIWCSKLLLHAGTRYFKCMTLELSQTRRQVQTAPSGVAARVSTWSSSLRERVASPCTQRRWAV